MKTILTIIPYGLTLKDFYELRDPLKGRPSHHFFNSIPEWCVRDDSGFIDYTENYHQFTGTLEDNSPHVYFLFDVNPVDLILQEEISNIGIEGVFEGYDWRPLFNEIPLNTPPARNLLIPINTHIVIDIEYSRGTGGFEVDDYEIYYEILGFLDGNMNLKRI